MAAPSAWTFFNAFKLNMANGNIDLDGHTFKCALYTSSLTINAETQAKYGDLTNEVGTTNTGYTTGGYSCGTGSWTRATTTCTFDVGDATWTAGSANLTARYAVLYDDTDATTPKALVAYCILDSTPADVTVSSGNTLTINIANVFTLS